jgi:hypothetical protein
MKSTTIAAFGLAGLVSGIVGVLLAATLLAWTPQVAPGPVSYPFTHTGFTVAQVVFFVHHWGLLAACVGLFAIADPRALLWRIGAAAAILGTIGLALAELNAIGYASDSFDAAYAGPMGAMYGLTSTLIGIGLVVTGIGVIRAHNWRGWHRWMPLVVGIAEFVILTPGLLGGFVLARLAIGTWMLLFGLLGLALFSEARRAASAVPPAPTPAGTLAVERP